VPSELEADRPSSEPTDEQARYARVLARRKAMSARDFADASSMSQKKARTVLRDLVAVGLAGQFKEGRTPRYFAVSRGARPDLGLGPRVTCLRAAVSQAEAERFAHGHARQRILGFLGEDERFAGAELVHKPVYKLDFEEQLERSLLGRLVGPQHEQRLGSVYLHVVNLRFLVFTPRDGLGFFDKPAEHASAVQDFDGVTDMEQAPPAALRIDEPEWLARRPISEVQQHFKARYAATPGAVSPIFVPLWRLLLQQGRGAGYRVVTIDALAGRPVQWPSCP
jgi:hypothetical protein